MLHDLQGLHSDFQIDHFVLGGNGCTLYGRYMQSLRELQSRLRILGRELSFCDEQHNDTIREARRFLAHAVALKRLIGEITPQRRADLDQESWLQRIRAMMAMDVMTAGGLTKPTIEILAELPLALREPLLAALGDPQQLIAWFWRQAPPVYELPEVTDNDLAGLIAAGNGYCLTGGVTRGLTDGR